MREDDGARIMFKSDREEGEQGAAGAHVDQVPG